MANEITITNSLQISNGAFNYYEQPLSQRIDQNNIGGGLPGYVIVSPVAEEISLTDLVAAGWCSCTNLDADYWIELGAGVGDPAVIAPFIRLNPGESAKFRLVPDIVLMGQCGGGSSGGGYEAKVYLMVFED